MLPIKGSSSWRRSLACVLLLCLTQSLLSAPPERDIAGSWKDERGDLLLISPRRAEGWMLRTVADGGRYVLTPDDESRFTVNASDGSPAGRLTVSVDGTELDWQRGAGAGGVSAAPIPVDSVDFQAAADDGVTLHGRFLVAAGQTPEHVILLVQGSGRDSGVRHFWYQDLFLANGFAVVVYDKRGTGRSDGSFTMDFDRLAGDVRAVAAAVMEMIAAPPSSFGLAGFSQGGWVAPLAAVDMSALDYVLVSYGLVDSPHDEARALGMIELENAGLGANELAQAERLLVAALDVVACDYRCGWPEYHRHMAHERARVWLEQVSDGRVQRLLEEPEWRLRVHGIRDLVPLSWHYRSEPLLENHTIPMAWMIAEGDSVAPPRYTMEFLAEMIEQGKPYVLHTYPGSDHGVLRFRETADGREYLGYDPRFFEDLVTEAKRLSGMDL